MRETLLTSLEVSSIVTFFPQLLNPRTQVYEGSKGTFDVMSRLNTQMIYSTAKKLSKI